MDIVQLEFQVDANWNGLANRDKGFWIAEFLLWQQSRQAPGFPDLAPGEGIMYYNYRVSYSNYDHFRKHFYEKINFK